jgi:hypothetical protein
MLLSADRNVGFHRARSVRSPRTRPGSNGQPPSPTAGRAHLYRMDAPWAGSLRTLCSEARQAERQFGAVAFVRSSLRDQVAPCRRRSASLTEQREEPTGLQQRRRRRESRAGARRSLSSSRMRSPRSAPRRRETTSCGETRRLPPMGGERLRTAIGRSQGIHCERCSERESTSHAFGHPSQPHTRSECLLRSTDARTATRSEQRVRSMLIAYGPSARH